PIGLLKNPPGSTPTQAVFATRPALRRLPLSSAMESCRMGRSIAPKVAARLDRSVALPPTSLATPCPQRPLPGP
ncbi:MAG TPA: hypothetical protein VIH59_06455, partial [Candidatus Tectomicrobia bacterium]